jgi:carbamoyltransferase
MPEMKDRINRIIKERENFRPFAPVVLEEEASQYFEMNGSASPFMLFTYPVKKQRYSRRYACGQFGSCADGKHRSK